MSTRTDKMNPSPSFTYGPYTWGDILSLAGKTSRHYCEMVQPNECKNLKNPGLIQRCQEEFRKCMEEATRFERWHRMN